MLFIEIMVSAATSFLVSVFVPWGRGADLVFSRVKRVRWRRPGLPRHKSGQR
jgi:hypothetical protein